MMMQRNNMVLLCKAQSSQDLLLLDVPPFVHGLNCWRRDDRAHQALHRLLRDSMDLVWSACEFEIKLTQGNGARQFQCAGETLHLQHGRDGIVEPGTTHEPEF